MQELINELFTLNQYQLNKVIEYIEDLKKPKKHRSLNQNAYAWELINELGNKLNKSKEDIYLQMLKDYGQSSIVSMLSSISPIGYFKYYEEIGKGIVNDKEFTHYKIYKGSSEYDTKEMTIFINGVIQECENVGIHTIPYE